MRFKSIVMTPVITLAAVTLLAGTGVAIDLSTRGGGEGALEQTSADPLTSVQESLSANDQGQSAAETVQAPSPTPAPRPTPSPVYYDDDDEEDDHEYEEPEDDEHEWEPEEYDDD